MGRTSLVALLSLGIVGLSAHAQRGYDPAPFVSRVDVALGYNYLRSNAPPNQQPKFSAEGGFASVDVPLLYFLDVTGEFTGSHANNISNLGQDLTLLTYQGGPRVRAHFGRLTLFAEGLIGAAHGSDSYFPTATGYTTSANSLAYSAGGGLDYDLTRRWAARGQAGYLHTALPNGVDNEQQHLSIGAGVVYRFGGGFSHPKGQSAPPAPEPQPIPQPNSQPMPGTEPAPAGAAPPAVTQPAPPAEYTPPLVPPSAPPPAAPPAEEGSHSAEFHRNVIDVLFDYDSYGLRQDALSSLATTAAYLKTHPAVDILVGGYSDERGTLNYNLSLGEKRASAVKEALVAAGIDAGRISIVSYGKGVQVCTADDEACWQRNRRAAFMIQP